MASVSDQAFIDMDGFLGRGGLRSLADLRFEMCDILAEGSESDTYADRIEVNFGPGSVGRNVPIPVDVLDLI